MKKKRFYRLLFFGWLLLGINTILPIKRNTKKKLHKTAKKNKKGERKIYDLSNRGDRETLTEKAIEKATLSIDPVEILNEGITIIMNGPYEGAIKADQTDETDNQYIVIGDYKLPLPIGSNEREAYYLLRHMTDLLLLKINDAMAETFSLSLETVVLNREEQQALSTIIKENKEKIDHLSKNTAVPSLLHNIPFINTVILLTMRALLKEQKIKIKENWWDTIKSFFGKNNTITMFGDLFDFIKEYPLYQEFDHLRNSSDEKIIIFLFSNLAYAMIHSPMAPFGFSPRFCNDMILAASLSNDKPLSEDKTHQHNQQINTTTISMLKELLKRYANIFNRRIPSLKRFNSNTALFAPENNILNTILLSSIFVAGVATGVATIDYKKEYRKLSEKDKLVQEGKEIIAKLAEEGKEIEEKLDQEGGEQFKEKLAQRTKEIIDKLAEETKKIKEIYELKGKIPQNTKELEELKQKLTQQSEELKELKKLQELKKLEGLKKLEELKEKLTQQSKDFKEK